MFKPIDAALLQLICAEFRLTPELIHLLFTLLVIVGDVD